MIPDEPEVMLDPEVEHLWHAFQELHGARGPQGSITFADIAAWCSLRGPDLLPWEVEGIRALDAAWLSQQAEQND